MDPLQWMGAIRMSVQTTDYINHNMTTVNLLMSSEKKMHVHNKHASKRCLLKCESSNQNALMMDLFITNAAFHLTIY